MENHKIIEFCKNAGFLFGKYPIDFVYLFGSVATNTVNRFSDIDIALVVQDDIPPGQYLDLEMELEVKLNEILESGNFDVRVINNAPLGFQGQVLEKSILLYSRDENRRVDFETKTRDNYFDFLPVLNQMRKVFFNRLKKEGLLGQCPKTGETV